MRSPRWASGALLGPVWIYGEPWTGRVAMGPQGVYLLTAWRVRDPGETVTLPLPLARRHKLLGGFYERCRKRGEFSGISGRSAR